MKICRVVLIALSLILAACGASYAATSTAAPPPTELSAAHLEELVRPIALYPDPLLQNVLAAATFPDQILEAALFNEQNGEPQAIKEKPWDRSVKFVANYPAILVKMARDIDWTIAIGGALVQQNEALRAAIQSLRARARAAGNLKDTEAHRIIVEESADGATIIRIEPIDPLVLDIPTTTTTIYDRAIADYSSVWAPLASFGLGLALGYAFDDDEHYYYGPIYGPGFWSGGPAHHHWVEHHRERWHDHRYHPDPRDHYRHSGHGRSEKPDRWELNRKDAAWREARGRHPPSLYPENRARLGADAREGRRPDISPRASLRSSEIGSLTRPRGELTRPAAPVGPVPYERGRPPPSSLEGRTSRPPAPRTSPLRGGSLAGLDRSGGVISRESARGSMSRGGSRGGHSGGLTGGGRSGGGRGSRGGGGRH